MEKIQNKKQQEKIVPLFEDLGNTHIHDEKSYQDLKNKEPKNKKN